MAPLRDANELIGPELAATLQKLTALGEEDAAAVKLAERYAAVIDGAEGDEADKALATFGPKLLAVLEQLGATPKARAAKKGGGGRGESKLAQLRASRPA